MTDAPVVRVAQGELQGRVVTSPTGKSFFSFQGVPYAKPPLGSLRFQAPHPPEEWEGIRDATAEGNISAQIDQSNNGGLIGDENCLFLNVYTPNLDGEFLPVMIYIHGGGYRFGSGSSAFYGADYLVEKDVVVVTINYRCGALGFLSLNTPEVPGNAGLKDVIQAIRWVKDNIHSFGGNSGNITVFGESVGGATVSILTASNMSKGLINKAVIQSGTALHSWAFQKNPIDNAKRLAQSLGSESEDADDILEFLRATSVRDIVEANEKMHTKELFYERGANIFAPVIEKEFPDVEAVLTESFIDILTSGRVAEIPIMIGTTSLECSFERTSDDLQVYIPEELKIERNSEEGLAVAESLKKLYFKGHHTGVESLNEFFELLSDKLVNIDTHRYVQYLVKVSNKPIYYYRFDYVGELNIGHKCMPLLAVDKAGHMDELGYLFKNDLQKDVEPTPQDIKMRERMLRLWTNFAKSGNPTPDENHYITVTWQPVTRENLYYLNLGPELSLATNPDKERMDFWDALYAKYFKIWEHPKVNTEESPRKADRFVEPTPEIVEYTIDAEVLVDNGDEVSDLVEVSEEIVEPEPEPVKTIEPEPVKIIEPEKVVEQVTHVNGNGISNEIKMAPVSNGAAKDMIRANDPPEDDLPKNIGVNKFVNFFESLGGKK